MTSTSRSPSTALRLGELFDAAVELGYSVSDEFAHGWVDEVAGMPLIRVRQWLRGQSVDIDIFLAESRFQTSLLARRMRLEVDDVLAWVASPEDLILLKLIAARPRDIGGVARLLLDPTTTGGRATVSESSEKQCRWGMTSRRTCFSEDSEAVARRGW